MVPIWLQFFWNWASNNAIVILISIQKGGDDVDINRIAGAPDPTAGGNGSNEENVWHLDGWLTCQLQNQW